MDSRVSTHSGISGEMLKRSNQTTSKKLNRYKSEKKIVISFLKDSFPRNFPIINIILIAEAEIRGIISSLKPKNSLGYDEITSKIVKSCASLISIPLSYIYNYSLHAGIFPDHLKMAEVKNHCQRGETNVTFQIRGPFHCYQPSLKYLRKQYTVS